MQPFYSAIAGLLLLGCETAGLGEVAFAIHRSVPVPHRLRFEASEQALGCRPCDVVTVREGSMEPGDYLVGPALVAIERSEIRSASVQRIDLGERGVFYGLSVALTPEAQKRVSIAAADEASEDLFFAANRSGQTVIGSARSCRSATCT